MHRKKTLVTDDNRLLHVIHAFMEEKIKVFLHSKHFQFKVSSGYCMSTSFCSVIASNAIIVEIKCQLKVLFLLVLEFKSNTY